MDVLAALRRRRRGRERRPWQPRRDWFLRDLESLAAREWELRESAGRARGGPAWLAAAAYSQLGSSQQLAARPGDDGALRARDWPRPDFSYVQLPARGAAQFEWDVLAVCGVCALLLLLALCALLESCGWRVVPRRCSRKYNRDCDEPPTSMIEPPLLEDLPPPYTDSQPSEPSANMLSLNYEQIANMSNIANYTPIANESPPPAYSEVFVQIPNLKVYYANETQDTNINEYERDSFNNEINENVANDCLENSGNTGENVEVTSRDSSVLV